MEILNIDELATPANKKVVLAGTEYEVKEITVQSFIDTAKASKALDEDPNATEGERVEQMVNMISSLIPDCPREVLMNLEFKQLNALVAFGRGVLADEIRRIYSDEPNENSADKGGQKKGRKSPAK